MPLPHFLLMLAAIILVAAATLWVALWAGVPAQVLALVALVGAAVVHLTRTGDGPHHTPGA
ncbi:hypothetical protein [uncultured Paracoccus sp.]|uniref:hypothetical protein n=1 Tax=uncultured Paracoccus sp. TaxID=189685 RepID=UPI0026181078|nr:hypothetical protein [uncultured Paracoccus sp.]